MHHLFSEFCGYPNNDIPMKADTSPSSSVVDYLLEPAPKQVETKENEKEADNDTASKSMKQAAQRNHMVIFAVDVSGSMATTTEVPALQGLLKVYRSDRILSVCTVCHYS